MTNDIDINKFKNRLTAYANKEPNSRRRDVELPLTKAQKELAERELNKRCLVSDGIQHYQVTFNVPTISHRKRDIAGTVFQAIGAAYGISPEHIALLAKVSGVMSFSMIQDKSDTMKVRDRIDDIDWQ